MTRPRRKYVEERTDGQKRTDAARETVSYRASERICSANQQIFKVTHHGIFVEQRITLQGTEGKRSIVENFRI